MAVVVDVADGERGYFSEPGAGLVKEVIMDQVSFPWSVLMSTSSSIFLAVSVVAFGILSSLLFVCGVKLELGPVWSLAVSDRR